MGKKKGGKQVVVEQDLSTFTAQQDRIQEERKNPNVKKELPPAQQAFLKAQEHAEDSQCPGFFYLDNKMIENLTLPLSS